MNPIEDVVVARVSQRLGLRVVGEASVLPRGPGHRSRTVVRVPVSTPENEKFSIVLKFALAPTAAEQDSLVWEHDVTTVLHTIARTSVEQGVIPYIPVPETLTDRALWCFTVGDSGPVRVVVSARRFLASGRRPLTARSLGRLMARQHLLGSSQKALELLKDRPANVFCGLDPRILARAVAAPAHPFRHHPALLTKLFNSLEEQVTRALEADKRPLLIHKDLHPMNCVATAAGPVSLDWAEAGWGSRADDFAWLHLAVTRFGTSVHLLEDVCEGYAEISPGGVPALDQIQACGRVRELVCLAFSIMNAGLSPAHLREARRELPILADPGARTEPWAALFNPGIFAHPLFRRTPDNRKAS